MNSNEGRPEVVIPVIAHLRPAGIISALLNTLSSGLIHFFNLTRVLSPLLCFFSPLCVFHHLIIWFGVFSSFNCIWKNKKGEIGTSIVFERRRRRTVRTRGCKSPAPWGGSPGCWGEFIMPQQWPHISHWWGGFFVFFRLLRGFFNFVHTQIVLYQFSSTHDFMGNTIFLSKTLLSSS